jgi:hypothetical protein
MAARMGIRKPGYSPFAKYSFDEQEAMMKTGVFSVAPAMSLDDWNLLESYILKLAPEKLDSIPHQMVENNSSQFRTATVNLDSAVGSTITFLDVNPDTGAILASDFNGRIMEYNHSLKKVIAKDNFDVGITSYIEKDSISFVTLVGNLNPSELAYGRVYKKTKNGVSEILNNLHRPVHNSMHDFDNDGTDEIIVSEFGNLTGKLSLWKTKGNEPYQKRVLLGQPGVIRTIVSDMNNDGKDDIIALTSQGNEGITILYQTKDLNFKSDQVLRFNPVFGTSWFDLIDFNKDGFKDIITVHGDNADRTFVNKPYHGMRIHLNDGNNGFEEAYFYALHGASRFVANDFDKDGDIDIGLVSSFPDYEKTPELSFLYLENTGSDKIDFIASRLKDHSLGRWLIVDSGDVDNDGDDDIVLGSFTYYFTPVPDDLFEKWSSSNVDLMILENQLR